MRIPIRRNADRNDGDPMTPMIDVVFLLLVFFICASVGTVVDDLLPAELSGTTEAPDSTTAAPAQERWDHPLIQIRLVSGPTGMTIQLEEQTLPDLASLAEKLARLSAVDPESAVVLNIADEVEVQDFISVYDLCQSLKLQNISFAVRGSAMSQ